MLSAKKDDKYLVLSDFDRFPTKVDAAETDRELAELRKAVKDLAEAVRHIYRENETLYSLLEEEVWSRVGLRLDEGEFQELNYLSFALDEFIERLGTDDDVPDVEEIENLRDLGFRPFAGCDLTFWQKVLEDSEEKEMAEEVVLTKGKPIHRKRTIFWEQTGFGKSSREIRYETLPIDDRLTNAIKNQIRDNKRGE